MTTLWRRLPSAGLRIGCLVAAFFALGGCSYLETVAQRTAAPDDRLELNWGDGTLYLNRREMPRYTCAEPRFLFQCERAGPKFACRCMPR